MAVDRGHRAQFLCYTESRTDSVPEWNREGILRPGHEYRRELISRPSPLLIDTQISTLALLLPVALVQLALYGLCRGMGRRLRVEAVSAGLIAPLLLLAPWLPGTVVPLPLGVIQSLTPGGQEIAPTPHDLLNDTVLQLLPWEREVRRSYADGHLPLWSERLGGGSSPWVNPQAAVLAPLTSAARLLPIERYPLTVLLLKLLVAIEGLWLLSRTLGASRAAATVAALGFGLGGGMMGWALYPLTEVTAWLPWMLAGTIVVSRRPSVSSVVSTGMVTAAVLLSGHPETAFAGCILAAIVGLALRRVRRGWGPTLLGLALAGALGIGLAAVQWIPFVSYLPDTFKARFVESESVRHTAGVTYPGAGWGLLAPLHPHAFGRPYTDSHLGPGHWPATAPLYGGIVGAVGLLGALLARRRRLLPFLIVALLCALSAIGFAPLLSLHSALPLLAASNSSRYLMTAAVATAACAALGLDWWLRRRNRHGDRKRLGLTLGGLALVSLSIPWWRGGPWSPWVLLTWLLVLVAMAAPRWPNRARFAVLLLVVAIDLVPWARSHIPRAPASQWPQPTDLVEEMLNLADPVRWRVVGMERAAYPAVLPWYGLADVRPHNSIADGRHVEGLSTVFDFDPGEHYFAPFRARQHPFLDFLNVRLVVHRTTEPPHWRLEVREGVLPRVFLAKASRGVFDGQTGEALARLGDPREVFLTIGSEDERADADRSWSVGQLQVVRQRPGLVVLDVATPGPALLATSWPRPQDWTMRVDGASRESAIRINGAYAAFPLAAGKHRVELRFLPSGFRLGLVSTGVSLAIAISALLFSWARRRGAARVVDAPSRSRGSVPER